MVKKPRLFTPGPTPLLPAGQQAMASFALHHRTAEYRQLHSQVLAGLKQFIGTKNGVLLLTCSGTGAMEAAVTNLTSRGDRVLVLSAGKFGERWRELATAFGCQVEVVAAPYGQTFSKKQIKEKLSGDTRVVFMQATESSTGARHDVEAVAQLLSGSETLLVVDAITGLGTTPLEVDAWGVDVIIGGSQKALMAPPGLAYLAVSERAWQRMENATNPRYYFDLRKERKAAAKGETSFTPATALVAALGAALEFIGQLGGGNIARGRQALIANAELMASMTRTAAVAMGLELFAAESASSALTAISAPPGVDSGLIVKSMSQRFGAEVANGQGEMKGKIFRIAHLGYYDPLDTLAAIGALEQVLSAVCKPRHVEFGVGLRAAQAVLARTTAEQAQATPPSPRS